MYQNALRKITVWTSKKRHGDTRGSLAQKSSKWIRQKHTFLGIFAIVGGVATSGNGVSRRMCHRCAPEWLANHEMLITTKQKERVPSVIGFCNARPTRIKAHISRRYAKLLPDHDLKKKIKSRR